MQSGKVRVGRELRLIGGAVDGLQLLAQRHADPRQVAREPPLAFATAVASTLSILRDRLQLLESVVTGASPPGLIASKSDEETAWLSAGADDDLVIPEWTNDERLQHLEEELKGAKARLDSERREREAGPRLEVIVPGVRPRDRR